MPGGGASLISARYWREPAAFLRTLQLQSGALTRRSYEIQKRMRWYLCSNACWFDTDWARRAKQLSRDGELHIATPLPSSCATRNLGAPVRYSTASCLEAFLKEKFSERNLGRIRYIAWKAGRGWGFLTQWPTTSSRLQQSKRLFFPLTVLNDTKNETPGLLHHKLYANICKWMAFNRKWPAELYTI